MARPTNLKAVGGYQGCVNVGCFAQNLTTGNIAYFNSIFGSPDKGFTLNVDPLKNPIRETTSYETCDGTPDGLVPGSASFETKELSITYLDSYNQKLSIDPTIAKNLKVNILQGGVFEHDGDKWAVIGSQGARNIGGTRTTNNDFKYFLFEEGKVFTPNMVTLEGTRQLEENGFVTGGYGENNTVVIEVLYNHSTEGKSGHRIPYVIGNSNEFGEGSGGDVNKYTSTMLRCSEVVNVDKKLPNGLTNYQTMQTSGADVIKRIYADILIEVSGGGVPTVAGTIGQQAVVIDLDDGTVEMYLHDGTDWGTTAPAVTSTLQAGSLIYSRETDTALDGATSVDRNVLVAVKTAGATGVAVAVDTFVYTAGTGATTYILPMYDYSFTDQGYVVASGEIV